MNNTKKLSIIVALSIIAMVLLIVQKVQLYNKVSQAVKLNQPDWSIGDGGSDGNSGFDSVYDEPNPSPTYHDEVGGETQSSLLTLNITPDNLIINKNQQGSWTFQVPSALKRNQTRCLSVFWGDGQSTRLTKNCLTSVKNSTTLTHKYSKKGTYTISAWLTDSIGNNTHFGYETVKIK